MTRAPSGWPGVATWMSTAGLVSVLILQGGLDPELYASGKTDALASQRTDTEGKAQERHADASPLPVSNAAMPLGPALDVPKEILNLLDQRKRYLDQREDALRLQQDRLREVKRDLEELLDRYEATVKAFDAKQEQAQASARAQGGKAKNQQASAPGEQSTPLETVTKIYEAMPPEEAALRIEKMPSHMAVKVLRSLRSKTAGAILAQVRADKAATLTVQLFGPSSKNPTKPSSKK
ncbi:hypothetical protein YTPLAS18_27510 [Nitrospira sp.]|nr:hypothetical protein YTPLAS18_27510 [Nitrospira sp.]